LAEHFDGDSTRAEAALAKYGAQDDPKSIVLYELLLIQLRPWSEIQSLTNDSYQARLCLEQGRVDEGIELCARDWPKRLSWFQVRGLRGGLIMPMAFAGRIEEVDSLLDQLKPSLPISEFWRATAFSAAGQEDEARARLTRLLERTDLTPVVRQMIRARLDNLPGPPILGLSAQDAIERFTIEIRSANLLRPGRPLRFMSVVTASVLLVSAFGYQAWSGGVSDMEVVWKLGALYPQGRLPEELWRLLAYGFLHGGLTHLFTNIISLLLLGPFVVRGLGIVGFYWVFFGGMILAGLGISFFGHPGLTVGASGGVIALMGSLIPVCLWHPVTRGTMVAKAFLKITFFAVVLQSTIDASNAVISFAGHFSGLVSGMVLGGLLVFLKRSKNQPI
jgi:membrane associated rhomboid family serine protease